MIAIALKFIISVKGDSYDYSLWVSLEGCMKPQINCDSELLLVNVNNLKVKFYF